jgi:1-acyl-sn-glycerol-3-phosphate acyltransferase
VGSRLFKRIKSVVAPLVNLYFRAEVRGLDYFPPAGGALLVCNHSGGVLTPGVLVLAPAF